MSSLTYLRELIYQETARLATSSLIYIPHHSQSDRDTRLTIREWGDSNAIKSCPYLSNPWYELFSTTGHSKTFWEGCLSPRVLFKSGIHATYVGPRGRQQGGGNGLLDTLHVCQMSRLRECDGWVDGLFRPYVCVSVRVAIFFINNILIHIWQWFAGTHSSRRRLNTTWALWDNIVIMNNQAKTIHLLELTCPAEKNIEDRHTEKSNEYAHFVLDITDFKCKVDCFEVSSKGFLTSGNLITLTTLPKYINPQHKTLTFHEESLHSLTALLLTTSFARMSLLS